MKRDKAMKIKQLTTEQEKAVKRLQNENSIAEEKQNFQLNALKEEIDFDRMHDEKTLTKYKIDATERIYSNIGVKEIKINQFSGKEHGLTTLIPTMAE